MNPIGKTFSKLGESFTVQEAAINGLICRSHEDNQLWFFTYTEVRRILENQA